MGFFIGFLTFILVLDCFVLILLVLMQLPKKDAGVGVAFGGGATDALFGAGSGNVLTNATKYAATIFFALALVIGILQSRFHDRSVTTLKAAVGGQTTSLPGASGTVPATTPDTFPTAPSETSPQSLTITNLTLESTPAATTTTNAPAPE